MIRAVNRQNGSGVRRSSGQRRTSSSAGNADRIAIVRAVGVVTGVVPDTDLAESAPPTPLRDQFPELDRQRIGATGDGPNPAAPSSRPDTARRYPAGEPFEHR